MKKTILSILVFVAASSAYSQVISFKVNSANGLALPANSKSMHLRPDGKSATVNMNAGLMSCYLKYKPAPFQRTIAKGTLALKIDGPLNNATYNATATNEEIAQMLTDVFYAGSTYPPAHIQEFHDTLLSKLPNCQNASDYLLSKNINMSCSALSNIKRASFQDENYTKSSISCVADRSISYVDLALYLENASVITSVYEL